MSQEHLRELARRSGFMKRQSKLDPELFVDTVVFSSLDQQQLSLQDCCNDLAQHHDRSISKVALHKRFSERSVSFLKLVLADLMVGALPSGADWVPNCPFGRILVCDSTKFSLPAHYAGQYPGYGGCRGTGSLMNIQYSLDIKDGTWERLQLARATQNDQAHSAESVQDMHKGDLLVRDLGYVTKKYLKGVLDSEAYFVNRLPPKWQVYHADGTTPLDWSKLYRRMEDSRAGRHEQRVTMFLDNKAEQMRLVAVPVPRAVWEDRIRKAAKHASSKGVGVSDEYRIRCRFNVYITNATECQLDTDGIIDLYRLRWQIELMFKVWKSLLVLHRVKAMNAARMESMLWAKFIWIMINWKIFCSLNAAVRQQSPEYACSIWKFFKSARNFSQSFRGKITNGLHSFKKWCMAFIIPIVKNLTIEPKKDKKAAHELLEGIRTRLWEPKKT